MIELQRAIEGAICTMVTLSDRIRHRAASESQKRKVSSMACQLLKKMLPVDAGQSLSARLFDIENSERGTSLKS